MVDKVKKIWIDGQFIDWDAATIPILTHTFHYGLGVFDGMRAYKRSDGGTYVFRLREHVDRLFDSCKMCFLRPEVTREQLNAACVEILRENAESGGLDPVLVELFARRVVSSAPPLPLAESAGWGPELLGQTKAR